MLPVGALIAEPDRTMLYRPLPGGRCVRFLPGGGWVVTRMNSLALRGPDLDAKLPDRLRIAVYGDSMVQAVETPLRQTLTVRLASALTERGASVETVNAGMSGYGVGQSLLKFEAERDALQPDLVVLSICVHNDSSNLRRNRLFSIDDNGELLQTLDPKVDGLIRDYERRAAIAAKPALIRLYLHVTDQLSDASAGERGLDEQMKSRAREARKFNDKWQAVMKGVLRRFQTACEEHDIQLVVMLLPSSFDLVEEYMTSDGSSTPKAYEPRGLDEAYVRLCTELDLPCIDLYDAFQAAGARALFLEHDIHLSPQGHDFVAREISRFLVDGGWVEL